jgi:hypothetical protein
MKIKDIPKLRIAIRACIAFMRQYPDTPIEILQFKFSTIIECSPQIVNMIHVDYNDSGIIDKLQMVIQRYESLQRDMKHPDDVLAATKNVGKELSDLYVLPMITDENDKKAYSDAMENWTTEEVQK